MPDAPDDSLALCTAARARASGGPMSEAEVLRYRGLLEDPRTVPDPDDPPSYDWIAAGPLAGGGELSVRHEAREALRARGGEALARVLEGALATGEGLGPDDATLAVEVLGTAHPLLGRLLHHTDPAVRARIVRGFVPLGLRSRGHVPVLAPLLLDPSLDVAAAVKEALRAVDFYFEPLPPDVLAPAILRRAEKLLAAAAPEARAARRESLALLAMLTRSFQELARALAESSDEALGSLVAWHGFGTEAVDGVIRAEPGLRPRIKGVVAARVRAEGARSPVSLRKLACFAPDGDALELAASALSSQLQSGLDIARFAEVDVACLPVLVKAALAHRIFRDERPGAVSGGDAGGVFALAACDPVAFTDALAELSGSRVDRHVGVMDTLAGQLSNRRRADEILAAIRKRLAERAPAPRRKASRRPRRS